KLAPLFSQEVLQISVELPDGDAGESLAALLIPDAEGPQRKRVLEALAGGRAVIGPPRPWSSVKSSYQRAVRTRMMTARDSGVIDTEDRLVELVLSADRDALDDLRGRILAPLDGLRASTAERLAETLKAWVLHLGRREAV